MHFCHAGLQALQTVALLTVAIAAYAAAAIDCRNTKTAKFVSMICITTCNLDDLNLCNVIHSASQRAVPGIAALHNT